jgi:lipopolysaccharide assembly protein B
VAPAYLNLCDLRLRQGDAAGAVDAWERLTAVAPERAYLAFDRLESAYTALGVPNRFDDLCRRLINGNPQDWRARLALAKHLRAPSQPEQRQPEQALDLLLEALAHNPHAVVIHQTILETLVQLHLDQSLVNRYIGVSREAVFYSDPHICMRCRYRSNELLWQCPHCHEWNTFVEERIAAAQDTEEAES